MCGWARPGDALQGNTRTGTARQGDEGQGKAWTGNAVLGAANPSGAGQCTATQGWDQQSKARLFNRKRYDNETTYPNRGHNPSYLQPLY